MTDPKEKTEELLAEAERGRSERTPWLILGGVHVVVIAIVAVVRTRAARVPGPLIIAVIALLCALVLPWLALWLGTGLAPQPPTTP